MKKFFACSLAIVVLAMLSACGGTEAPSKPSNFTNTYEMTAELAESGGIQPIAFRISYPPEAELYKLEPGEANSNYCQFFLEEGTSYEELSLGWMNGNPDLLGLGDQLLSQFEASFGGQLPGLETVSKGQEKFGGEDRWILKMRYNISADMEILPPGTYNTMAVLYPQLYGNQGLAALFTFMDGHPRIKSFNDIESNSVIYKIMQTLEIEG